MVSPDFEAGTLEKEVIKQYWQQWNALVETRGFQNPDDSTIEFEFAISREAEEEALFTADEVSVARLDMPLEEWHEVKPYPLTTEEGEIWIEISINPKDPYKPRIGIFREEDTIFYYTEDVVIYLSNRGRAFEYTGWNFILEPDAHQSQIPNYSYLKRLPQSSEIQIEFREEPIPGRTLTESFQSLKGQNLERLDYLLMKVKAGDII